MSKKMIAIMKKEFARFFGDKRLVFHHNFNAGAYDLYFVYTSGAGNYEAVCRFEGLCISDLYGGSAGGLFSYLRQSLIWK